VSEIESARLVLRLIDVATARSVLDGHQPDGMSFADDYPSQFSIEVMDLIAGARAGEVTEFDSYFMIRKTDGAAIGEIGSSRGGDDAVQVGYSVVESVWGRGYASEALRVLLAELLARVDVERVIAATMVDHVASRRVMEKAGMCECGRRRAEEGGETVELVVYERKR
jgi:ribosomal-protein-alanine N-acetyltransferase